MIISHPRDEATKDLAGNTTLFPTYHSAPLRFLPRYRNEIEDNPFSMSLLHFYPFAGLTLCYYGFFETHYIKQGGLETAYLFAAASQKHSFIV